MEARMNLTASSEKGVPIGNLIPPDYEGLAWMQAIDWSLVERRVAERFAQIGQPEDAPLPTRLAVSLAIFNYETGHLPEDAPHAWSEMPMYQFLSGATHYKMELPCDPTVYCRWRKHFGEAELEALIDSLGVVPRARYKHTIRHESVSLEEGFRRLQEGILRQIKKMEEKSRNPKPSKRKKSSKPKKTATKPQTPKAPEMQPFLPGFPQDND